MLNRPCWSSLMASAGRPFVESHLLLIVNDYNTCMGPRPTVVCKTARTTILQDGGRVVPVLLSELGGLYLNLFWNGFLEMPGVHVSFCKPIT